jgi:5'-deoxynucleotidase YfbR-like HD superfamily hydrolase
MKLVEQIKQPILQEMELFESKFRESMATKVPLLNRITHYIVRRKGKQMRPMFVFLVADEFKLNIDTLKAVKMALVHDLVEIITDDVDAVEQYRKNLYSKKALDEAEAIKEVVKSLSDEQAKDIHSIWTEFDEAKTPEAKFVFALDKIEGVFTLLESGHKAFTLPHLVACYGNEQVKDFPELKPLFSELKMRLKEEFKKGEIEWKDEYEV